MSLRTAFCSLSLFVFSCGSQSEVESALPPVRANQLPIAVETPPPVSTPAEAKPQGNKLPANLTIPSASVSQKIEDFCLDGTEESCEKRSLDAFYKKLTQTAAKEKDAVTRITQIGDSIINSDYISSSTKQKLQTDFGEAGRGYVFVGIPKFYYLADVSHTASGWTFKSVVTPQIKDQLYGIGGTAFIGNVGASASFETSKKELGQKMSRVSVYYLKQPKGGEVDLLVDGKSVTRFSTDGEAQEAAQEVAEFEEGSHKVQLKVTKGAARLFGVSLETKGPGVVYDAIGQLSNTVFSMLRAKPEQWQAQLALRQPDLVVLSFGANDAGYVKTKKAADDYVSKQAELLRRVRAALPEASCVLFGPMDGMDSSYKLLTDAQRQAAKEVGCAFWDTRAFMGGDGAATAWKRKGLLAGDGVHPSVKGGQVLGEAFASALEVGFAEYIARLKNQ